MPTAAQSPMGMVMAGRALGDANVTAQAMKSGVIGTWKAGVKGAAKAAMDEVRDEAVTDDPFRRSGAPTGDPGLNFSAHASRLSLLMPAGFPARNTPECS